MRSKVLYTLLALSIGIITPSSLIGASDEEMKAANKQFLNLQKNEKEIQVIKGITTDVTKNLSELKNFQIQLKTKKINLTSSSIIELDLHYMHFTKIYFPHGTIVTEVKSSAPLKDKSIFSNKVEIRPKEDFIQASISISFFYDNKNYDITIIANRYDVSNKRNINDNKFYPKVELIITPPLTAVEVIKTYRADFGELPKKEVEQYSINNVIYTIQRSKFKKRNPLNKSSLSVFYNNETTKYKITQGSQGVRYE